MASMPVLIAGEWVKSTAQRSFHAVNPRTKEPIPESYPISDWVEIERTIRASADAFEALRETPVEQRATFLDRFAERVEARADELVAMAHAETGLPVEPRLKNVELPRTTNQLRQAAVAARERSWQLLTIDSSANIRSMLAPIGPVNVFGPNNFPFAFNSAAGGDFAAAIAAGNPVIAKANSSHPGTTRLFAEEALAAIKASDLHPATVQLLYRTEHADGEKLVSHPLIGATGYTGARSAGLVLKKAADAVGKPIYLELSSVNPVVILPGALQERLEAVAADFCTSCLMGAGQFCTNPGMLLLIAGAETEAFLKLVADKFRSAPVGTLLSPAVQSSLEKNVATIVKSGADVVAGGTSGGGAGCSYANTLLRTSGSKFRDNPHGLQTEAFGNVSLAVVVEDRAELLAVLNALEGNLTGTVYSHTAGDDDRDYQAVEPALRAKVGRLLNDKMPTGVAVSPAMNHGGPFPATGHPAFTAVGIPAAIRRFASLYCYDNVREHRLPIELRDENITATPWRLIDGNWTRGDVS